MNYNNYNDEFMDLVTSGILIYLVFGMFTRAQIIVNAIMSTVRLFFGLHLNYSRPMSMNSTLLYVFTVVLGLLLSTLANMIIVYFSEVSMRLKVAEQSSI